MKHGIWRQGLKTKKGKRKSGRRKDQDIHRQGFMIDAKLKVENMRQKRQERRSGYATDAV